MELPEKTVRPYPDEPHPDAKQRAARQRKEFIDAMQKALDRQAREDDAAAVQVLVDNMARARTLQFEGITTELSEVKASNPKDAIGVRKAGLSAVPMNVIAEVGVAMLEGAAKYGRHNYRAVGVRASVYFDAAVARHLLDWWEGEDIDAESGLSHVTKAISALVVLRDSMLQGNWVDDRPPRAARYRDELNAKAAEILDRHADKNPHHYTELEPA